MGAKTLGNGTRTRRRDVLVTVALCTAVFGVMLYFQAHLYATCRDFNNIQSLDQLHAYVQRFVKETGSTDAAAKNLMVVSKELTELVNNSTQLTTKQQEVQKLQDKLSNSQIEVAAAKQRISSLEQQLKELTSAKEQLATLTTKIDQHTKDLDEAKKQVEQLTKQKEQLEKDKEQLEQQQHQHTSAASTTADCKPGTDQPIIGLPSSSTAAINTAKMQSLAVANLQCNPVQGHEFHGDPILVWGYDHHAADAAECCAACHAYRAVVAQGGTAQGRNGTACSMWSFCGVAEKCGTRLGECWLRGVKDLPAVGELPANNKAEGWISGLVYDDNNKPLAAYNDTALVFTTKHGEVQIDLLPDLAPASVKALRRAAATLAPSGFCSNCRIYRPEKNFLVQGIIEAPGVYVATPRHPNPPQRMMMERGLVCWAGGGGGPHWFVNMVNQTGFKDDHLCFGMAKDMILFEKILELPVKEKQKPNDMNGLVDAVYFNITLRKVESKLNL